MKKSADVCLPPGKATESEETICGGRAFLQWKQNQLDSFGNVASAIRGTTTRHRPSNVVKMELHSNYKGHNVSNSSFKVVITCKACGKKFVTKHGLRRMCLTCSPPSTKHEAAKYRATH